MAGVVIVGAGLAGAQTAIALRQNNFAGPITLIGQEQVPPYQRPPLSKNYLKGTMEASGVHVRPELFWLENDVELRTGTAAAEIDRDGQVVTLADGEVIEYDHLVLATGASNRVIPHAAGMPGVFDLRTLDDADALRPYLEPGSELVVVGGGFIGLEVAAAAREREARVTVIEALDRVMARVVSPEMSTFFQRLHEAQGVRVLTKTQVQDLLENGRRMHVLLNDTRKLAASCVLVGIGVVPNVELARRCDLEIEDGIVVNDHLLTSDPNISAIGDCAFYPCAISGRQHRLESIQNATDQARCVAARLTDNPEPYVAVPWFWTEQFGRTLQIAGVAPSSAESVFRGRAAEERFSVCRFVDGRLSAVESVNQPADHIAARKLLASGAADRITREQVADVDTPLKSLVLAAQR